MTAAPPSPQSSPPDSRPAFPPARSPAVGGTGLPDPPRIDRWPEALRSAERLRGTLVRCGPGLRGVGWPETPRVRLSALAPWLGEDRIAVYLTAAWVWGAVRTPGQPIRLSTRGRARRGFRFSPEVRMHELRVAESEIIDLGPFGTTSPLRTALDLLHDASGYGLRERVAVRLLLRLIEGGRPAVLEHLMDHRRPGRASALTRLSAGT